ncbi:hypothetical protein BD770DRAFT_372594 [Pilaira anomala]|nr:hypothetical protein BD770DRAFT_372594 [Pilaira anomala]
MSDSNTKWVLSNYKSGTQFPALGFAKHSRCEDWSSCVSSFRVALNDIAQLKLHKKDDHRDCILWARNARRKPEKTLNTILVKQYFYLKAREKFMVNKSFLKQTMKNKTIENEIALLESQAPESQVPEFNTLSSPVVEEHNAEFEAMFKKLDNSLKWFLSTGKCVDDELFVFGIQCSADHPSRSLIIDPYDENYAQYNIFTPEELEEIKLYQKKPMPLPTKEFKAFLNSYNHDSSQKIRTALGANHQFHADYDKDINADKDWVNYVVHSLVREYEFGNMDRQHTEAWYQSHIWSMIESCFDKVKGIEAVTGESASLGSKRRMNQNRTPTAINNMSRLAYGHKCDLVFRQYDHGHNLPLEFGGSEAKPKIEEDYGTNFMKEGLIKLPRMLKDMMDALLKEIGYDNRSTAIRTVGILHSGLSCTMVELDRPTTYVSRVSRSKKIEISNKIEKFGSTVLPAILSSWVCCEIVKDVLNVVVNTPHADNNDDFSWLDTCLERPLLPSMPATSSSSETSRKKQKSRV